MKNIELKIVCDNLGAVESLLKKAQAQFGGTLVQRDTYFNCPKGKLKLREINENNFELIFYQRPDRKQSRVSSYQVLTIPKKLATEGKNILQLALGEKVIVEKRRKLWLWRHTRIHLDRVKGLGNFLELETVLSEINLKQGQVENQEIIKLLGIGRNPKIAQSYSDLLLRNL
jgi:predicted adenylyl cyclase CyaB